MKKIVLWLIKQYQKTFSLDHGIRGKLNPNLRYCKFIPTCSEYGYEAIDKYGVFKGSLLALKRIMRCNHKTPTGTYDPVP
ncbi:MAG: membrane protein insertion efficiency factor YidD [Candidatus Dojkabacteria bacterium]|jgi:putative membrane protein insertion efficiency factor